MTRHIFALCLAFLAAFPAFAQTASDGFRGRAGQLPQLLAGNIAPEDYFGANFLAQIPAAQIRSIATSLIQQNGKVERIESVRPISAQSGIVLVAYQNAIVRFNLSVDEAPPHRAIGLLVASVERRNDSTAALLQDFKALPGSSGLAVVELGQTPRSVITHNADKQFAIGSGFKLWVLAALAEDVAKGQRRWDDVVTLGPPSLPSGMTQDWPARSPMTLHSLATLMTSISDNTASDTLLAVLGRDKVAQMAAQLVRQPERTLPILSTAEAFALKMNANSDLRTRWISGDRATKAQILRDQRTRLTRASLNMLELGAGPKHIDTIEWFATPFDMARSISHFKSMKDPTPLQILSISKGIPQGDAERFAYLGYKGGSEIGVIALSFLVQNRAGKWFAVSGAWNNPAAAVDNDRFNALMLRALALAR